MAVEPKSVEGTNINGTSYKNQASSLGVKIDPREHVSGRKFIVVDLNEFTPGTITLPYIIPNPDTLNPNTWKINKINFSYWSGSEFAKIIYCIIKVDGVKKSTVILNNAHGPGWKEIPLLVDPEKHYYELDPALQTYPKDLVPALSVANANEIEISLQLEFQAITEQKVKDHHDYIIAEAKRHETLFGTVTEQIEKQLLTPLTITVFEVGCQFEGTLSN